MSQNILYFSNIPFKSEFWTFLYFIILYDIYISLYVILYVIYRPLGHK